MLKKYIFCFFLSMVPILELRGGVPIAVGMGIHYLPAVVTCVIGNMIPVPFIYLFARKVLLWGKDKPGFGSIFHTIYEKGEAAGERLHTRAGLGGLFIALVLFVGIPLPGTGAWTGTLAASFLDMGFRHTTLAVVLGLILSGSIMAAASLYGIHIFGL